MGAETYAVAKGAERMSAAQQAVATGLDTMVRAIDAQDAAIAAMVDSAHTNIWIAITTANAAETAAVDAVSKASEANARLADFTGMTFWQRVNWIITGRC
jgi:hypothetical protein